MASEEEMERLMETTENAIYEDLITDYSAYSFDRMLINRIFTYINDYYLLDKPNITKKEYIHLLAIIKSKAFDFFEKHKEDLNSYEYKSINDIMKDFLGQEIYQQNLTKISALVNKNSVIIPHLEEVDGGKRKTKKYKKNKKNKSNKKRKLNKRKSMKK
jgi:hypothetical protein